MSRNDKGDDLTAMRRKRRGGFRQAGASADATIRQTVGSAGFAEPDVLLRWIEIAGPVLAAHCRPVKVEYGSARLGATLVVQVASARAPEVEMQAPKMRERINQFYGYGAISRIRITQSSGLGSGFSEGQRTFEGLALEPSKLHSERASRMAGNIKDPDLRAALTRMGAHVLSRTSPSKPQGSDT